MGTPTLAVSSGKQQTATVVQQDGFYLVVRLDNSTAKVVCLRIGAVDALPGYERVVSNMLQDRLLPGDHISLTWIGMDSHGVPCALVADPRGSIDRSILHAGIAVPLPQSQGIAAVSVAYQTAIIDAAKANRESGIADENTWHTMLPKQRFINMYALDEPDAPAAARRNPPR